MQGGTGMPRILAAVLLFFSLSTGIMAAPTNAATNSVPGGKDDPLLQGVGKAMGNLDRTARNNAGEPTGGIGTFVETILILTLFLGALYALFRFIQKKKGTTATGESSIKLLSSRSLGGSRMLQLVEVGEQVFFIGVGDGSVNLIAEISDRETVDQLRMEHARSAKTGSTGFLDKLFALAGREKAGPAAADKLDYLKEQKERLKRMDRDNKT